MNALHSHLWNDELHQIGGTVLYPTWDNSNNRQPFINKIWTKQLIKNHQNSDQIRSGFQDSDFGRSSRGIRLDGSVTNSPQSILCQSHTLANRIIAECELDWSARKAPEFDIENYEKSEQGVRRVVSSWNVCADQIFQIMFQRSEISALVSSSCDFNWFAFNGLACL